MSALSTYLQQQRKDAGFETPSDFARHAAENGHPELVKQSISRTELGKHQPTFQTLDAWAELCGKVLRVDFIEKED